MVEGGAELAQRWGLAGYRSVGDDSELDECGAHYEDISDAV